MGCHCCRVKATDEALAAVKRPSTPGLQHAETARIELGSEIRARYRLGPLLGTGSFGQVRLCMDRQTEQMLACKIMAKRNKRAGSHSVDFVRMFRNEIAILKTLNHKHVIKLIKAYEDDNFLYAVLERCEGGELFSKIVQRRRFSERDAARLCQDMLAAIAYIHAQRIVHRDIKAENFLFFKRIRPLQRLSDSMQPLPVPTLYPRAMSHNLQDRMSRTHTHTHALANATHSLTDSRAQGESREGVSENASRRSASRDNARDSARDNARSSGGPFHGWSPSHVSEFQGRNRLVLIDFGMSVYIPSQKEDCYLRQLCGSPHYVAPELIGRRYREEVDMWSLGIVVFLMLYGHYPFEGTDQKEIAQKILYTQPDYHRVRVSEAGLSFLKALLEKDPARRATAEQAAQHRWLRAFSQDLQEDRRIESREGVSREGVGRESVSRESGRDPGRDFGREPGREAGRDSGREAGRDPGRNRDRLRHHPHSPPISHRLPDRDLDRVLAANSAKVDDNVLPTAGKGPGLGRSAVLTTSHAPYRVDLTGDLGNNNLREGDGADFVSSDSLLEGATLPNLSASVESTLERPEPDARIVPHVKDHDATSASTSFFIAPSALVAGAAMAARMDEGTLSEEEDSLMTILDTSSPASTLRQHTAPHVASDVLKANLFASPNISSSLEMSPLPISPPSGDKPPSQLTPEKRD